MAKKRIEPDLQEKEEWKPDRSRFKDGKNGYITQSLFLEIGYTDLAYYTLSDEDKVHNGICYKSLRKLYLETEDPTEYEFASKYLWGWEHWQRLLGNKQLAAEIEKWREELEVKLRAKGVRALLELTDGNFNAAKWAADGRWSTKRGRPSREELERERAVRERALKETESDSERIVHLVPKSPK